MSRSLPVSLAYIERVKLAVKRNGYPRQKDLADELLLSLSNVGNYLNGRPVDILNFQEISDRLGQDWQEIAMLEGSPNGKEDSAEPILDCPEEETAAIYVERSPVERDCFAALLRHFLVRAKWSVTDINERRLQIMEKTRQTRIASGFSLIVDDSGQRKSGNFTAGVVRQYIGQIGKIDNGIVVVTTHLYDGRKSLPLDIELYQQASSLAEEKKDPNFRKKPEIALELIERSLSGSFKGHARMGCQDLFPKKLSGSVLSRSQGRVGTV